MGKSNSLETFLLFETAAGYALLLVKEWDVIGQDIEKAQIALQDPAKFAQQVSLRGWQPFKTSEEALENQTSIAKGQATDFLKAFLDQSLPSKKKHCQLGISDGDLAKDLAKAFSKLNVIHGKDVFEITRCLRMHVEKMIPGLKETGLHQYQLGLAHCYSRTKIASDPARQDKHAQQAVALIELVDKTMNKFAMRLREWYGWHFPELLKIVADHKQFAECALCIRIRDQFDFGANRDKLLEILDNNEELVEQIGAALNTTMGQEIHDLDMVNIETSAKQVIAIAEQRNNLNDYLGDKMTLVAPNLKALVGEILGGKLITQAGSVTNLAKAPSSTIQILGAEKALFRALKSRGPTPKYGLLFTSGFIGKATPQNKGRVSRYLANKIALAARLDAFSEKNALATSGAYGMKFKEQVEERLKFLTDGVVPKKNIEVMMELAATAAAQ